MAVNPGTRYTGKIGAASADYPYGTPRNVTTPSDGTGTPLEAAWLKDWFGLQAALFAEAGITPTNTPDTALVCQTLEGIKAAALNAEYEGPAGEAAIAIKDFIARMGLWASTEAEIQAANDYYASLYQRGVIHLPPGGVISITSGLDIDSGYTQIRGNGATLSAVTMSSGTVLTLATATAGSVPRAACVVEDLLIRGPAGGASGTLTGVDLTNAAGGDAPSASILRNLTIQDCGVGERHGDSPFPSVAQCVTIRNCGVGVLYGAGVTGVANRRESGKISGCATGIRSSQTLALFSEVLEDNDLQLDVQAGRVGLLEPLITAQDYSSTTILLAADTFVDVQGGLLEVTDGPLSASVFASVMSGATLRLVGTELSGTLTTSGNFATGDGEVIVRDIKMADSSTENRILLASQNLLVDGGFEEGAVASSPPQDDIFLTETDDAVIDDRYVGNGTSLLLSSAQYRSGSQSLAFYKYTAANHSSFALMCVPVQPGQRLGGRFFWRKPGNPSGNVFVKSFFAKVGVNEHGVPIILARGPVDNGLMIIGSGDSGWIQHSVPSVETERSLKAPSWATHFIVEIGAGSWYAGTGSNIYFDDLLLNVVG